MWRSKRLPLCTIKSFLKRKIFIIFCKVVQNPSPRLSSGFKSYHLAKVFFHVQEKIVRVVEIYNKNVVPAIIDNETA